MLPEVAAGFAGGVSIELVKCYKIRDLPINKLPQWVKSPFYWLISFLMALAGGGLVALYILSGFDVKFFMAFNIGLSAPLILKEGFETAAKKPALSDVEIKESSGDHS